MWACAAPPIRASCSSLSWVLSRTARWSIAAVMWRVPDQDGVDEQLQAERVALLVVFVGGQLAA